MIIYYDDRSVRVTSETVRIDGRSYPLREFARIWHRRDAHSWRALASRGGLVAAILGPLVLAAVGIAIGINLPAPATVTIAVIGGSCLVALTVGPLADILLERVDRSYSRGAHELEIWGQWRGSAVRLLRTRDALRFGQIYRALQRAMEATPARNGGRTAPRAVAASPTRTVGRIRVRPPAVRPSRATGPAGRPGQP